MKCRECGAVLAIDLDGYPIPCECEWTDEDREREERRLVYETEIAAMEWEIRNGRRL